MANDKLSSQIDLSVSPTTTASWEQLGRQLQGVQTSMRQLVDMVTKGLSSTDAPFIRDLRAVQKEMGGMLAAMRGGSVGSQINGAAAAGDLNTRRFTDQAQSLRMTENQVKALREYNRLAENTALLEESQAKRRYDTIAKTSNLQELQFRLKGRELAVMDAIARGDTKKLDSLNRQVDAVKTQINAVRDLEKAWDSALKEDRARTVKSMAAASAPAGLTQEQKDAQIISRAQKLGVQRITSDGGASIFAVQAALLSNYLVLNQVQSSFRFATQYSIEFENALKTLQAITQSTTPQMRELQSVIMDVSNSTRFSAVEIAQATVTLGQAGLSVGEIQKSLKSITLLATATGSDLGKAVDLVTSVMGSYKMTASETGQIADMVTQALNLSKLDIDKFQLAIQYAGNTAAQAGVQFGELLSAVSVMSNTGIKSGSTLGTGVRQLISDIEKPTKEFQDTLARLGLTEADVDLKSQGLYNTLRNLHDAGFTASDALGSFEVRAASAFNALNANLDSLKDFEQDLNNTGAAARANATQMDSLGATIDRFRSQAGLLASTAFKPLLDGFKEFLNLATNVMITLRDLGPATQILATAIGAAGLGLAFGQLFKLGAGLVGVLTTAAPVATAAGAALTSMGGGAAAAAVGIRGLAAAVAGLGAGPLGMLVGVLAAVGFGAYATIKANDDLKRSYEQAATGVNQVKDSMTGQQSTIDAVSASLENLRRRQANIKDEDLAAEAEKVARQFEQYGRTLDTSAIKSTDDLIAKLKELQAQLRQEYVANFGTLDAQLRNKSAQAALMIGERQKETTLGTANGDSSFWQGWSGMAQLPDGSSRAGAYLPGRGIDRARIAPMQSYLRALGLTDADAQAFGSALQLALPGGNTGSTPEAQAAALKTLRGGQNALTRAQELTTRAGIGQDDDTLERVGRINSMLGNLSEKLGNVASGLEEISSIDRELKRNGKDREYEQFVQQNPEAQDIRTRIEAIRKEFDSVKFSYQLPRGRTGADAVWSQMLGIESGGNQNAVSKKGAVGVAQVMKDTGPEAARLAGVDWDEKLWRTDAAYNEKIGRAYFDEQVRQYGGNTTLGAAAYNAGPGSVNSWLKTIGDPRQGQVTDSEFAAKIPFTETRDYISKISRGLGALGNLDRFNNSPALNNASSQAFSVEADLKARLKEATDAGDLVRQKLYSTQLSEISRITSEYKAAAEKVAKAAEPLQKDVESASSKELEARISEARKRMENEGNPVIIKQIGDEIVTLVREQGNRAIEAAKIGHAKPAPGQDYSDEVRVEMAKAASTRDANIKAEQERTIAAIRRRESQLTELDLAKTLQEQNEGYQKEISGFKQRNKDRSTDLAAYLKRADLQSVSLQQQSAMMSDPRFSGQYSSVQREDLAVRQAQAEEDALEPKRRALEASIQAAQADVVALTAGMNVRQEQIEALTARKKELDSSMSKDDDAEKVRVTRELNQLISQQTTAESTRGEIGRQITDNLAKEETLRERISAIQNREQPMDLQTGIKAATDQFMKSNDPIKMGIEGYSSLLGTTKSAFADFFISLADGSATAGNAFKTFATTIIKAMMDILAQQLAMQTIKSIVGLVGSVFTAAGAASGAAGTDMGAGSTAVNTTPVDWGGTALAATGGRIGYGPHVVTGGYRRMASGGKITGGNIGRDSVHVLAQPGEIMMNRSAVSAVGEDFLLGLNSMGNTQVSRTTAAPQARDTQDKPTVVNVWVVSPDQQQGMGPNDVVAVISDDISRGGSVKKLIKQVSLGQL